MVSHSAHANEQVWRLTALVFNPTLIPIVWNVVACGVTITSQKAAITFSSYDARDTRVRGQQRLLVLAQAIPIIAAQPKGVH